MKIDKFVVTIGKVSLVSPNPTGNLDKIYLAHADGEAGEFDLQEFAEALEKFFWRKF